MTRALTNQRRVFKACLTQTEQVSDDVTLKIGPLDFITRSLYICYPIFKVHFFVFMEVFLKIFCPSAWLVFWSGSNQEPVMMAHVRYSHFFDNAKLICLDCPIYWIGDLLKGNWIFLLSFLDFSTTKMKLLFWLFFK